MNIAEIITEKRIIKNNKQQISNRLISYLNFSCLKLIMHRDNLSLLVHIIENNVLCKIMVNVNFDFIFVNVRIAVIACNINLRWMKILSLVYMGRIVRRV